MNQIPTPQKLKIIEETQEKLKRITGYVLVDYRGLTVAQISQLRRNMRKAGDSELSVIKNTLFRKAAKETGVNVDTSLLEGPTAVLFTYEEPMEPIKALTAFMKDHPNITIKGGAFEQSLLSADQVRALSKIPAKPVLQGQLAGVLQAPMSQMAGGLNALLSQMARLLQAHAEKQGATA